MLTNSFAFTFEDSLIASKSIKKGARKKAHIDEPGKESEKAFFEQTPLRNTIMSGLGPKYSYLIRDFANRKYVSGLFAFLFNTHR